MKRSFLTYLIAAALIASPLYLSGCGESVKPGSAGVSRQVVSGVSVAEVASVPVVGTVQATGTVKAKTVSTVSSKLMGTVTSIVVREGDRVKKGALLLTIDDRDIRAKSRAAEAGRKEAASALAAAEANLKLQELTYERYKKLYEGKAVSEQEFDTVETRLKAARLDRDRAAQAVKRAEAGASEVGVYGSYARVVSPVDGVVAGKKIEVGSMAAPGIPLVTIEDTSSFVLEANADERLAGKIHRGSTLTVTVGSLSKTFPGRVTEVVPSVEPASRSFLVKIALTGTGLRSGLYGTVSIPVDAKEAVVVPLDAVVARGQLTGVYAVDEKGVVTYRLVRIGEAYGSKVEVLSGLTPGEKIIVEGMDKAVDGGVIKSR